MEVRMPEGEERGLRGEERLLTCRNLTGLVLGLGTSEIGDVWNGPLTARTISSSVKGPKYRPDQIHATQVREILLNFLQGISNYEGHEYEK